MIEFLVGLGWGLALLFAGLWVGERGRRRYVENMQIYGTPNVLKKARFTHPDDPEDRIEQAIDQATGQRRLRAVRQEDTPPAFDPLTVQNGVAFLLAESRARGEQLSEEEARDEAVRMLNAEGPEMS